MRSRRILIAALSLLAVAPHAAGGQSQPPPCSPQVTDQPEFDAVDLDEAQSSTLVATHSLQVSVSFFSPTALVDDHTVVVSVAGISGPSPLRFSTDTPGSLTATATWIQSDGTAQGSCSASASSDLTLAAPTPIPRFTTRLTHQKTDFKYALGWSYGAVLGPLADHRAVLVRWRGWRKPRLPGPSVPFRTLTAPLRTGDPGYRGLERSLPLPRMSLLVTVARDIVNVKIDSKTTTHHDRPVAYDIWLTQADRTLARFRLAGKCSAFNCTMRTVKVQR